MARKAIFTVTLDKVSSQTVSVDWATAADSAAGGVGFPGDGTDYAESSGTLTFAPGETQKTIEVMVRDTDSAAQESFNVVLSNPTGCVIADGTGIATLPAGVPVVVTTPVFLDTFTGIVGGIGEHDTDSGGLWLQKYSGQPTEPQPFNLLGDGSAALTILPNFVHLLSPRVDNYASYAAELRFTILNSGQNDGEFEFILTDLSDEEFAVSNNVVRPSAAFSFYDSGAGGMGGSARIFNGDGTGGQTTVAMSWITAMDTLARGVEHVLRMEVAANSYKYFLNGVQVWENTTQAYVPVNPRIFLRDLTAFGAQRTFSFNSVQIDPPPATPTGVIDNFDGPAETNLFDHTPDVGGAWGTINPFDVGPQLTGDGMVSSYNHVGSGQGALNGGINTTLIPQRDSFVELDVLIDQDTDTDFFVYLLVQTPPAPGNSWGLNDNNYVKARFRPTAPGGVYYDLSGNGVSFASTNGASAVSGTHTLKLFTEGNNVYLHLDGVLVLSSTLTASVPNPGYTGFQIQPSGNSRISAFRSGIHTAGG